MIISLSLKWQRNVYQAWWKMLVTNNVASVDAGQWTDSLNRCAIKEAGRSIESIEMIAPDGDFPSLDGRHPLKMA